MNHEAINTVVVKLLISFSVLHSQEATEYLHFSVENRMGHGALETSCEVSTSLHSQFYLLYHSAEQQVHNGESVSAAKARGP